MKKSIEYKQNHAVDALEEKKELGAAPSPQRRTGVLSPFRRSLAPSELGHNQTGIVTAMRKPALEQERRNGAPKASKIVYFEHGQQFGSYVPSKSRCMTKGAYSKRTSWIKKWTNEHHLWV